MKIKVGHATDVGLQRKRNEDSYVVYVPWTGESGPPAVDALLVVADGMGGESGGDRASQLVCERFRRWFTAADYRDWEDLPESGRLREALRRAFVAAGKEIYSIGLDNPELRGMGTTAVLAVVEGDDVTIAHVGDSRCYRIRDGVAQRLTKDHSWVQQQVETGLLTQEQADHHTHRNIILRSMGDEEPSDPDFLEESLEVADVLILCSDGLNGGVGDHEILAAALEIRDPQCLADRLVQLANEKDGSDNVTVVVALFEGDDPATDEITRPDLDQTEVMGP